MYRYNIPYQSISTSPCKIYISKRLSSSIKVRYHVIVVALLMRSLSSFSTSFKPCSCRTLWRVCENLCHQIHKT